MHQFFVLLGLCVAMFIGSMISGIVPLSCPLNPNRIKILLAFGAGMLLTTSTGIIIPEGFHASFESHEEQLNINENPDLKKHINISEFVMGFTLTCGYLFMFLIDHLSHNISSIGDSPWISTFGLSIHAAADGLALAAAAFSPNYSLKIIVFVVIALHKAPAAFGLVSFLLERDVRLPSIRKHLLAFSLAAPSFALLTYLLGLCFRFTQSLSLVGPILLFSGGTFLYIATSHVLPELKKSKNEMMPLTNVLVMITGCAIPLIISFAHVH